MLDKGVCKCYAWPSWLIVGPSRSTETDQIHIIPTNSANALVKRAQMAASTRIVVFPVDDSTDSERSFDWLVANFLKDTDEVGSDSRCIRRGCHRHVT